MSISIQFDLLTPPKNIKTKTKFWNVSCNGIKLGLVRWYNPWRKYVFCPYINTLYDSSCLECIATFCINSTAIRKSERKQERYISSRLTNPDLIMQAKDI